MDDLLDWSWFRGLSFFDFAIKFYESSRYRPTFEGIQYIIYTLVDTYPTRFIFINKIYNIIIAVLIYYFTSNICKSKILGCITAIFYTVSHLSYYQIGQGIGSIESTALILSISILYLCLKLTGSIGNNLNKGSNKNVFYLILIYILFFLLVFDHERYLSMSAVIFLAIVFMKQLPVVASVDVGAKLCEPNVRASSTSPKSYIKLKIISIILLILEILLICYIRYLAIGKVMPAGTGGTRVEETFSIIQCLNFCINQVKVIFGINVGPDHLYGIDFASIEDIRIKYITYLSIVFILLIVIIYFILKIKNMIDAGACVDVGAKLREPDVGASSASHTLVPDLLFLTFIAMCIGSSSVTIRIEMRFVYVSFIASVIYLAYMCGYIINQNKNLIKKYNRTINDKDFSNNNSLENNDNNSTTNINKKWDNNINKLNVLIKSKIYNFIILLLFILVFITRLPVEIEYRNNYDKIYCFVDLKRVNSLYDLTIGTYGLDRIINNENKMKIYIVNKFYNMTNFYSEYFFKIYDKENIGNNIILVDDFSDLPLDRDTNNSIVLYEDPYNNTYVDYTF